MNFARKLYEIAMRQREKNKVPHVRAILRDCKRAAKQARMQVKVTLPSKARFVKEEIGLALYKEGFSIETEYFHTTGSFYVIANWSKEEPKSPKHSEYGGLC
ncbi:hypothetical protein [Bacillus phage BC-T25]|nr:hypothetical protein [Bacillus phage BC-T25]